MGAQLVREVASKTSDEAGDGTTTATVLAHAMLAEGMKYVVAGMNPMDLKRGIVVRARTVLKDLAGENADQTAGVAIVYRSLATPLRQIVTNAGLDPSTVVDAVEQRSGSYGYNAASGTYGDMFEMGVLDPTKVARHALLNAASVAGLILTTDCMVAERPHAESSSAAELY